MRTSRFGGFLLGTGVAVGVAAVVGLVTGFEPSQLPAALLDIAVYKLTFAAAAGLLVAGAVLRRYARRDEQGAERPSDATLSSDDRRSEALPQPPIEEISSIADPRTKVEIPKRS
jgi:hypothetical protein